MDTKQLQAKKAELEAAFEKQKQAVISIDNLIQDAQGRRTGHVQEMNRLQGEHRLVRELLGEDKSEEHGKKVQGKKR